MKMRMRKPTPLEAEQVIRMKILETRGDFQNNVKEIRNRLELPKLGLSFDAEKRGEFDVWHKQFYEENTIAIKEAKQKIDQLNDELTIWEQSGSELAKIKNKLVDLAANNTHRLKQLCSSSVYKTLIAQKKNLGRRIDKLSPRPEYFFEEKERVLSLIPENAYNEALDSLLVKYQLPISFKDSLDWYIKYNKIRVPAMSYRIREISSKIPKWVEAEQVEEWDGSTPGISIDIFAPMKQADLRAMIRELKSFQTTIFPRGLLAKIRPHAEIDKILALNRAVRDSKTTAGRPRKIVKETSSDYFDMLKKDGKSDTDIKHIIHERRMSGIRKPKRKFRTEKTSRSVARSYLKNSARSSTVRKAKITLKKLQDRIVSQ